MKNKIFYIFAFFLSLSFFFHLDTVNASFSGSYNKFWIDYSKMSDLGISLTKEKIEDIVNKFKTNYSSYASHPIIEFQLQNNNYIRISVFTSNTDYKFNYTMTDNTDYSEYRLVTCYKGTKYTFMYNLSSDSFTEGPSTSNKDSLTCGYFTSFNFYSSHATIDSNMNFIPASRYPILLYSKGITLDNSISNSIPITYDGVSVSTEGISYYDFLNSNTLKNPTFSNSYITGEVPGYEEEQNVATLVDIDFGAYDTTKYEYYISTDSAESWENVTSYMTDSHFTHTMVKNGTVIAKIVSKSNGDEVYSTFTTDSINENALSYFIKYITNENENVYVEVDGKKYLQKKYLGIEPRYNKLEDNFPFNYKISFGNDIWENMLNNAMSFYYFDKNTTVYISVYDKYGRELGIYSTFTITGLEDIEIIGEKIIFTEECDKEKCIVSVSFTNYTSEHFYWVKTGNQAYKKINPSEYQGVYYFEDTSDVTTYCARITDKNVGNLGIVQDKCFITNGNSDSSKVTVNIFANIFDGFRTNIMSIVDVFTNFYNGLPDDIQNMFYLCLFILLTISLFKFLI